MQQNWQSKLIFLLKCPCRPTPKILDLYRLEVEGLLYSVIHLSCHNQMSGILGHSQAMPAPHHIQTTHNLVIVQQISCCNLGGAQTAAGLYLAAALHMSIVEQTYEDDEIMHAELPAQWLSDPDAWMTQMWQGWHKKSVPAATDIWLHRRAAFGKWFLAPTIARNHWR